MDYRPIPGQSPVSDAIKDLRRSARQDADTTAGQLHNTKDTLAQQIEDLQATVGLLLRQSQPYFQGVVNWQDTAQTSGTGNWVWLDFDTQYDFWTTFTTSSTGRFRVDTYALLMLNNGSTTKWAGVAVSPEILEHNGVSDQQYTGGGDVVSAPAVGRGPQLQGVNMGLIQVPGAMSWNYFLEPNHKYRVRLRRAIMKPTAPDTSWAGVLRFLLNVTLIGM